MVPDELDDDCWLLLHEVRLRGVRGRLGRDGRGARASRPVSRPRAAKGLRLTPEGRERHTAWARVREDEVEAAVERAYQRFLALNRELIRVCNDWQVRPGGAPNDHADPTYDWSVVDRLVAIDDRVGPILRSASQQVIRGSARTGRGFATPANA